MSGGRFHVDATADSLQVYSRLILSFLATQAPGTLMLRSNLACFLSRIKPQQLQQPQRAPTSKRLLGKNIHLEDLQNMAGLRRRGNAATHCSLATQPWICYTDEDLPTIPHIRGDTYIGLAHAARHPTARRPADKFQTKTVQKAGNATAELGM